MSEPQETPLRVSWSSMQSYLTCPRKYELSYVSGLQRKPSADHRNLMLGSAFHAGIQAALLAEYSSSLHMMAMTTEWMVKAAVDAARAYIREHTVTDKMVRDYTAPGAMVLDFDYYNMVREVGVLVVELLRYHIPLLGLGSRYIVPSVGDVVRGLPPEYRHADGADPVPAVEWHFEYPLMDNVTLSGYIDAVLWDTQTNEYVIVDWKTRGNFPFDDDALIDGQLHLYAAVVNDLSEYMHGAHPEAAPIHNVVMWQFKTKTPSPASISKKTLLPNVGAKSYDTTWEVWCATLPAGINPDDYVDLKAKMKTDEDFQRRVVAPVTALSTTLARENAEAAVRAIQWQLQSNHPAPAVLSSNGCKFCDFAMLCRNPLRYGGDVQTMLDEHYTTRNTNEEEEDNE